MAQLLNKQACQFLRDYGVTVQDENYKIPDGRLIPRTDGKMTGSTQLIVALIEAGNTKGNAWMLATSAVAFAHGNGKSKKEGVLFEPVLPISVTMHPKAKEGQLVFDDKMVRLFLTPGQDELPRDIYKRLQLFFKDRHAESVFPVKTILTDKNKGPVVRNPGLVASTARVGKTRIFCFLTGADHVYDRATHLLKNRDVLSQTSKKEQSESFRSCTLFVQLQRGFSDEQNLTAYSQPLVYDREITKINSIIEQDLTEDFLVQFLQSYVKKYDCDLVLTMASFAYLFATVFEEHPIQFPLLNDLTISVEQILGIYFIRLLNGKRIILRKNVFCEQNSDLREKKVVLPIAAFILIGLGEWQMPGIKIHGEEEKQAKEKEKPEEISEKISDTQKEQPGKPAAEKNAEGNSEKKKRFRFFRS